MNHWSRYRNYHQEKGVSLRKYALEKLRLLIIHRLSLGPHSHLFRRFTTFEEVDRFIFKWQNGDYNLHQPKSLFSRGPAASIDLTLSHTFCFFWPFIEGLRKKWYYEKMEEWWTDLDFEPSPDQILEKAKELKRQRKMEKKQFDDLTPMQNYILRNMMKNWKKS